MPSKDQVCDADLVTRYLNDELNGAALVDFHDHLAECESCRAKLQDSAAGPDLWREAADMLSPTIIPSFGTNTEEVSRSIEIRRFLDALAPTDYPQMLGRIGDYEVSGIVGVGGMGAVLKGFDNSLHRVVAIKVMDPNLANNGTARTRFQREARAAAAIAHDNVIDIHVVAEANGLPYLVMPFARGPSLQKRIADRGPLDVLEIARIGHQIADGLAAAHEQGVVHRDIKPANILLNEGIERLWITDFGVARAMFDASMTQTGLVAGTPEYMSPEQARGDSVDHRSDLFSLGCVLYTACTGRPPFRAETAYAIIRQISDTEPTDIRGINPDIPEWLCGVIDKLMSKDPQSRFQNASEVSTLFEACVAHLQQPSKIEFPKEANLLPRSRQSNERGRIHPVIWASAIIMVLVVSLAAWQQILPPLTATKTFQTSPVGRNHQSAFISAPFEGQIVKWGTNVVVDRRIEKGDLIAEFRVSVQADSNKLNAQADIAAQETKVAEQLVAAFEKRLELSKLMVEDMKAKLEATQSLVKNSLKTEDAVVESAQKEVDFQRAEQTRWERLLETADEELDRLGNDPGKVLLRNEISRRRIKAKYGALMAPEQIENAKKELATRISEGENKMLRGELEIKAAKAELRLAQDTMAAVNGELANARLELARSRSNENQVTTTRSVLGVQRITAPVDGIVKSKSPKETLSVGDAICEIWVGQSRLSGPLKNLPETKGVPMIAGKWSDNVSGDFKLDLVNEKRNQYVGTWSMPRGETYQIQMAWWKQERRFVGTWSSRDQVFGRLILRAKNKSLDGAFTTDVQPQDAKRELPRLFTLCLSKKGGSAGEYGE